MLQNCTGCRRHIRISETACPFCATRVVDPGAVPTQVADSYPRVAAIALLAGFAAAGCGDGGPFWNQSQSSDGCPPPGCAPPYGISGDFDPGPIPVVDAGPDDAGTEDAGTDDAGDSDAGS